ncbi:lipoate-protein ligase [Acrasis kona]|uniref:lipoate--protein ligase n=1 Tax=Acrasis kona TaxID=1008807 RepID=A0AAW2YPV9_9EUKA
MNRVRAFLPHFNKRYYSARNLGIIRSNSNDPFVNLATEDYIFNECDPSKQYLYLWRNDKTVVIGKHQNPYKECHLLRMNEDGVHLTRRRSGGGAVYQDLGNTIFTFLSPKDQYDKFVNFDIIKRSLHNGFGITSELSGRNDLIISSEKHPEFAQRKISGSAFKVASDRAFHHGTLLVNLDTNALQNYLNPHKLKLQSKGVSSVTSRVVNLQQINPNVSHELINEEMVKAWKQKHRELSGSDVNVEIIDVDTLRHNKKWKQYHDELVDWDWRFGKTPEFSNQFETRFDWGLVDVYLTSENGVIKSIKIFSDTLFPIIVESLESGLVGVKLEKSYVDDASNQIKSSISEEQPERETVVKCIDDVCDLINKNN